MDAHLASSSVDQIVEAIGVSALAKFLGHKNPSTVSSWKQRRSIPVAYWPRVIEAAKANDRKDITFETLALACAARSAA